MLYQERMYTNRLTDINKLKEEFINYMSPVDINEKIRTNFDIILIFLLYP